MLDRAFELRFFQPQVPHRHEGMFGRFMSAFPLPCPCEPPYVPTVLTPVGTTDYGLIGIGFLEKSLSSWVCGLACFRIGWPSKQSDSPKIQGFSPKIVDASKMAHLLRGEPFFRTRFLLQARCPPRQTSRVGNIAQQKGTSITRINGYQE